ncbi:MAG: fibronectin type III domain-containing protein, partial [Ruminococcus sp.]|nr:fibronectin type III domain-containing protein [Ruminococcus sp.]
MTGVFLLTRSIPAHEREIDGVIASGAVTQTDMIKTVTGDRYFAVSTADQAQKADTDKPATADQKAPTYTKDTIPQVTGLCRLSEKADSLKIGWDEIDGVQGYRIYRRDDNDPQADYKLFSVVNRAGLDIRNLSKGSKYSFRVAPYIADGSKTYEGEPTEVTFGTAPTDVEGFKMTDETKTTISMSWDKNERADGYLMERCYRGKWSDYQEFDADTTEFTDTDLEPGKAYYYRIQAYRDDSTGRLPGAKTAIRTVAGLLGPEDKNSASKLGRVSLDYKDSKYADGYLIWYSKDKENWEQLTDTDRTHYSTSRLENGETYWFRIYPYRTVDGHDIVGAYTEMDFVANKEIYDKTVGDTYVEV